MQTKFFSSFCEAVKSGGKPLQQKFRAGRPLGGSCVEPRLQLSLALDSGWQGRGRWEASYCWLWHLTHNTAYSMKLWSKFLSVGGGADLQNADVLTCGDCNKKFPIQQLVKYIQHKATDCQKQVNTGTDHFVRIILLLLDVLLRLWSNIFLTLIFCYMWF